MTTLQNVTVAGLLADLGLSGHAGIAVTRNGDASTQLDITVSGGAYAILADRTLLSGELESTALTDLSTDGTYTLWLHAQPHPAQPEGLAAVWTVAASAPDDAAIALATVVVAGSVIASVTLVASGVAGLAQKQNFVPPPPLSQWTWINQGPYDNPTDYPLLVTAEDIPGGLRFAVPGPTNWPALIVANAPLPEPPYTITAFVRAGLSPYGALFGLSVHNSDSGETVSLYNQPFGFYNQSGWQRDIITSETIDFNEAFNIGATDTLLSHYWIRIQNDGSILHLYLSSDGLFFVEVLKLDVGGLGSFDQYGLYLWNGSNADMSVGPPFLEAYTSGTEGGRFVADLLSLEVLPDLVDTTTFR